MSDTNLRGMLAPNAQLGQNMSSRRRFLSGSAALLAGAALVALPGVAKAHDTDRAVSDVDILNYALTLERLEATFYRRVLNRFGMEEFENARVFRDLGAYLRRKTYENFQRISEHEDEHVRTLVSVIESLGGQPVPKVEYDFGVKNVADAVRVGQLLENTGVQAYDGAIAHIESAGLLTAGATIATVEARHASYLNLISREVPFPASFDEPAPPRSVCQTVDEAFITSAPEPYGPYPSLQAFCASLPNTTS